MIRGVISGHQRWHQGRHQQCNHGRTQERHQGGHPRGHPRCNLAITDALTNVIREASRDASRDAISQSRTHSRTSSGRPPETPPEMQSHLQVPALKLGEIAPRCIRHRPPEVITGDRLPIMALEVQIHPLAKRRPAKQRAVHPDHLWGRGRWRRGEHMHARQGFIRISCEPCGHQWSSVVISRPQGRRASPPPPCCTR